MSHEFGRYNQIRGMLHTYVHTSSVNSYKVAQIVSRSVQPSSCGLSQHSHQHLFTKNKSKTHRSVALEGLTTSFTVTTWNPRNGMFTRLSSALGPSASSVQSSTSSMSSSKRLVTVADEICNLEELEGQNQSDTRVCVKTNKPTCEAEPGHVPHMPHTVATQRIAPPCPSSQIHHHPLA